MVGRPPLPKAKRRDGPKLQVPLRESERKILKAAADRAGKPLATWLREVGLAEAGKGDSHGA